MYGGADGPNVPPDPAKLRYYSNKMLFFFKKTLAAYLLVRCGVRVAVTTAPSPSAGRKNKKRTGRNPTTRDTVAAAAAAAPPRRRGRPSVFILGISLGGT